MNNEELDSQLSAMFDDELPEAECQLLARRLSKDDALKARWRRYAVIGAAIRAERGVRLDSNLASRVSAALATEPALESDAVAEPKERRSGRMRWWQPVAGGAIAAGVAAMSVMWIRVQAPVGDGAQLAQNAAPGVVLTEPQTITAEAGTPETYVVPASVERTPIVPTAELANYVVAHSEFSAPVSRRNLLSAFIASDLETAPSSEESEDAAVVEGPKPNVEQAE